MSLSPNKRDQNIENMIVAAPANKLRAKRGPAFQESMSRIRGHNFAIRLLQTLEGRIHLIVDDFCVGEGARKQHSTLDRSAFISKFMVHIRAGPPNPEESSWLASMPDDELQEKLGEVFDSADASEKGRISFSTLMGYVIDCARYGEVGAVQEAIPEYTGSQGTFFRNLEDISKAKYCAELGKVLVSGKFVGIVNTQNLFVKSFVPYPHMTLAAEKFATTYDLDYIPHMESIAFVGTDLYIDMMHCETGEHTLRIPITQTYSVCSYDRSTKLLLAGRDNIVDIYGLQEYRLADQKYTVNKPLNVHSGIVNCIRPLQRGGLLATASSDKTVVISDLELGQSITTFRAHQHAVHSVEYIEHLNLMLSSAYDTEPKVWMLASSAMRSEAFTLRDVENPHTGIVVSACSIVDTPQVATLDSHGTVKLWDIRMFRAQQSIRLEKTMEGIFDAKALKWHSLLWDPTAQELFACAQRRAQKLRRKVMLKEDIAGKAGATTSSPTRGGSPSSPDKRQAAPAQAKLCSMADESPILSLVFEPVSQTVLSLSERKVRIWDIFTGHQEAIFDKIVPYETVASSICVSSTGKVFFLGFRNGRLTSHQYSSGVLLNTYVDEGPEISSLTYCQDAQAFCAVSWKGARLFSDRHDNITSFFPDSTHGGETKTATFDPVTGMLCCMERRGCISLWESRSGIFTLTSVKGCGMISIGHMEVSCACILSGYPVLALATHVGGIQLYTTSPHPVPNRKFAEGLFKGREITQMQFYPPKNVLYCGDDQGWIHAFDLSTALESVHCFTPSTSWTGMMSTVGRLGTAPKDISLLRTAYHVHAHMEAVGSLVWAHGSNILISSSMDQRILFWTLALDFIGELDPLSELGRFSIPLSAAPQSIEDYVITCAPDENIPFARGALPTSGDLISSSNPDGLGSTAMMMTTPDSGEGTFSAAKFAEDVHRIAVALESFVPSVKRKEKDIVKELKSLGVDESKFSKDYGKRAALVGLGSKESQLSDTGGCSGGGDASMEEDAAVLKYSVNSSGVACRSLFTPAPLPGSFTKKSVVVDQVTNDSVPERGGVPLTVTRNFPLPPNARRDRDWLLRDLQLQEQQAQAVAAFERDSNGVVATSSLTNERDAEDRYNSLQLQHSAIHEGSHGQLGNESIISQIVLPTPATHRSETAENMRLGIAFFSSPGDFETIPEVKVPPASHHGPSTPQKTNDPNLIRRLLPYELIQMRRDLNMQSRQAKRDAVCSVQAQRNRDALGPRASSFSSSMPPRSHSTPPLSQSQQRSVLTHSSLPALAMPCTTRTDEDVDWSGAPRTNTRDTGIAREALSRSLSTKVELVKQPQASNVPLKRSNISPPDVPDFCSFGVRSLTPSLMSRRDMKNGSWAKTHRVPSEGGLQRRHFIALDDEEQQEELAADASILPGLSPMRVERSVPISRIPSQHSRPPPAPNHYARSSSTDL